MKKMYAAWIFVIGVLMLALLVIGYNTSNKNKEYKAREQDMIEQASSYLTKNDINLSVGESLKLDQKRLIDSGLLQSNKVKDDECDGYVKITRNQSGYDYRAYIKCKNYTTEDYVE